MTKRPKSERHEILERIRKIMLSLSDSKTEIENLGEDESLLKTGVLDSLAMISLAVKIKETFKIELSTGDLTTANFKTLHSLTTLVASYRP